MYPIPVTKGNGPQCYCLFVPIWFADIHTLKGFETDVITLPGRSVSVRTIEHSLIVQVREFKIEDDAKSCFEEIHAAVLRAVASRRASAQVAPLGDIERGRGPIPDLFAREVYEPWPPRTPETDGIIWRIRSYILPDHERILLMPTATGRIIREVSPSILTDWFRSRAIPRKWPLSDKVELALAIAADANAQRSLKLEFLGLVNALEVLIEERRLHTLRSNLSVGGGARSMRRRSKLRRKTKPVWLTNWQRSEIALTLSTIPFKAAFAGFLTASPLPRF
jgi:hypothetical protein